MGTLASTRSRMLAALILSALAACLGLVLRAPSGPVVNAWVRSSYDALHTLSPAGHGTPMGWPVVIVYLDLPSYGKQGPPRPWPRLFNPQLLNRLAARIASAVVFDIVFAG